MKINLRKYKNYDDLIKILSTYFSKEDLSDIEEYYKYAEEIYKGMKRLTGEDYIYHPINVAYLLAELKMDKITIGCALIHEAIYFEKDTYENILEKFGEETAEIVQSITKISNLKRTFKNNIERYRKIVVGLADDPKSIFIKLADRLDNLKTIYVHPVEHQMDIVEETDKIFIPIAHRLGIKKFKSELEDLCLRISHPKEYNNILKKLKESKEDLENSLLEMREEIIDILNEHNIKYTILSRVKSVRGIYNKLQKGKKWENIYDMLGIRVLTEKIEDCYLIIGLIHSKFKPIPKRFKDYIANPKSNMYQSIHTTIFGVKEHIYEVQVRTYEMDEVAESGIASHWSYKENTSGANKTALDLKLEEFKALIDINDKEGNEKFFNNLNAELTKDEIYVFTPKGDVIELPSESTPIDFAYRIHTEIGNTLVGALVNDKMVKLNHELKDGDIVSLITKKGASPNKAWLKFVKTASAKGRIKSYFFKKDKEKSILVGKELIEEEIKKRNLHINDVLTDENIKNALEELNLNNIEDLYIEASSLKYTPIMLVNKLLGIKPVKKEEIIKSTEYKKQNGDILISGYDDVLTSIASCCNPVKGEEIVGYITKGNGVSIHRKTCSNVNLKGERIVEASWLDVEENKYKAYLNVYINVDNEKLINIISIASNNDVNIDSINQKEKNKEIYYELAISVKNIDYLNTFMLDLKGLKFVSRVERIY